MEPSRSFVAVVDDDASVRKALRRLLTAANFKVKTFAAGQELLDAVAAERPDCLLLDLHMPDHSGRDVQDELVRTGVSIPTVIITAFDEPESRARCLAAGAAAYLLKPLDDQILLDAIAGSIRASLPRDPS